MAGSEPTSAANRRERELNEAIPPAYTEYIGHELLAHIRATVPA